MRKSIATVSVGGTLGAKLDAIAAARFAGVELFDADLTCSALSAEEVAARCSDLGLGIDLFQPLRDVVGMQPALFSDRLRFAEAKFQVMERLGATRVLICSAVHPQATSDPGLAAEQLDIVGRRAAEHGISVAFEALAWGSYVNRVRQAWEIVEAVSRPNVGVCVDTFHLLAKGDDAASLADIPGDRIAFLQVADAPHLSMDVLEWSRHHRCFPGQGSLDVVGVVAAVVEAGYRGPLSLEVFSDIVREADPHDTARDAMRSVLYLEEQLRRHWDRRVAGTTDAERFSGAARPAVELFDPPPEPVAPTASYVEITAAPDSDAMPDLLRRLGFERLGADDSAGVWWANGGARILLNRSASMVASREAREVPAVASVGFQVDDAQRFWARAEALTWNPAEHGGTGDWKVTVTSPGGVRAVVADARAVAGESDDGNEGRMSNGQPEGWDGIDHVGAAVDVDRSDAEVSFYRTLFGLRPGPVTEFFDPAGRLRSRLVVSPDGRLRVVLNIVVRSGGATMHGVNQVAFGCSNLLDRVEDMRRAGAPLLQIPDSYYDDLRARLDVPPDLLATLRRLSVLYDRDGTGELLHVYTPLVAGRFYVELLERRGGYAGFGAVNTPTRLAMQAETPWITDRPSLERGTAPVTSEASR